MKFIINKNFKRIISLAISVAMLIGTFFIANVGIRNVEAAAAQKTVYWSGNADNTLADNGERGTESDPIIIDSAEELFYLCRKAKLAETNGKYYKVADGISTMILQPENVVDKDALLALDGGEATKTYLTGLSGVKNWAAGDESMFNGNFDGNGVTVYGLYAKGAYCGLFNNVDGGTPDAAGKDNTGIYFKNFAIKNSYFESEWRLGAIFAFSYEKGRANGAAVDGTINVDTFELANCYITNTASGNLGNKGVVLGGNASEVYHIKNMIVYGNYTTPASGGVFEFANGDSGRWVNNISGGTRICNTIENSIVLDTPLHDGSASYAKNTVDSYENVYTNTSYEITNNDADIFKYASTDVAAVKASDLKGIWVKSVTQNLKWASNSADGDWYAIEGGYPTVIKPEGWQDITGAVTEVWNGTAATGFAGGNGTEGAPYIIETPEQLFAMVAAGGKSVKPAGKTLYWNGTEDSTVADNGEAGTKADPIIIDSAEELAYIANATDAKDSTAGKYYKIADGISAIVLQNEAYVDAIKNLADSTAVKEYFETNAASLKTWVTSVYNTTKPFQGHFDGNGVTIYGMYADYTKYTDWRKDQYSGLFPVTGGGAVISNVTVKNSYLANANNIGALTSYSRTGNGTDPISFEKVIVANNYICTTASASTDAVRGGVMAGNLSHNVSVNNCLVYGNTAVNTGMEMPESSTGYNLSLFGGFISPSGTNTNTIKNSIILGATPFSQYSFSYNAYSNNHPFENVYTDTNTSDNYYYSTDNSKWTNVTFAHPGVTTVAASDLLGDKAAGIVSALNTANGSEVWYTGNSSGYPQFDVYGKSAYYKVADGVTDFYLNAVSEVGYEAVKTLAAGTSYNNWNTGSWTPFTGNFDGNGATVHGMISKSVADNKNVGFMQVLGNYAIIKNINFDTCYVENTHNRNAAVVASAVVDYLDDNADGTDDTSGKRYGYSKIVNSSVRNCSVKSTLNDQCAGFVVSFNGYADGLQTINCFYDGFTSELGTVSNGSNSNAGIVSFSWSVNNYQASGCVSFGAPMSSNRTTDVNYNDYSTGTVSNHPVYVYNSYTTTPAKVATTVIENTAITADTTDYITEMPLLDWANGWYIKEVENGRKVPMPRVSTSADVFGTWDTNVAVIDYNRLLGTADDGMGYGLPYYGKYGHFDQFAGSGTESDPYLITTPLELARAIGAGGKNIHDKLYFKLAKDIDVSGMAWLNTVGSRLTSATSDTFVYVPFEGTLDGAGHTITGLYAVNGNSNEAAFDANDDWKAGLIPEFNGGTVKNLHIRNSYAASGTSTQTGVLVGEFKSGTITGCSVEDIVGGSDKLAGTTGGTITNSYIESTYYNNSGAEVTADKIDVAGNKTVWYIGGNDTAVPKLLNRAVAMECADASGNGDGSEYNAGDLTSLRNKLLNKRAYQNIYADTNRDGSINIADLVIMRRHIVGDYNKVTDGFWRNVELGNVSIYYDCNDTQDMARKLELYVESVYDIDVLKYASGSVTDTSVTGTYTSLPSKNAIIVKKDSSLTYDKYAVELDKANNILTFKGGSFTAVEQAVIDFANTASPRQGITPTFTASILDLKTDDEIISLVEGSDGVLSPTITTASDRSYKDKVTVNGVDYYYAWGDEFDGSGSYSTNNWDITSYRYEGTSTTGISHKNKENPNLDQLKELWEVENGRLQIWRGVNTDVATESASDYTWTYGNYKYKGGYKGISLGKDNVKNDWGQTIDNEDKYVDAGLITTQNSMLFKQGYIEMEASLPSDGHAFPAWWFLTGTTPYSNSKITSSLYGKIYGINKAWNGTNYIDVSNPLTYQYQLPAAHLEFDIVEPMQTQNNNSTTAYTNSSTSLPNHRNYVDTYKHYKRDFNITIHKIYNENANANNLYIYNWNSDGSGATLAKNIARADFTSTSSSDTWIHRYDYTKYAGYTVGGSWLGDDYYGAYNMNRDMTATVKYGFAWAVNEADGTYSLDIYVNGTKVTSKSSKGHTIDETIGHQAGDDYIYNLGTNEDSKIWNQYAYMLLDNAYYTNNTSSSYAMFTDLLTKELSGSDTYSSYKNYKIYDKTTFEVNYVRVYQQDGMRDIITSETENFNTGNHYGYGVK